MVLGVQQLTGLLSNDFEVKKNTALTGDASFTDSLEAMKKLVQQNLDAEAETDALTKDFLTGANDNIHSLMIAQSKSSILMQYTLQLRNGVLDAYKQIMQLSV